MDKPALCVWTYPHRTLRHLVALRRHISQLHKLPTHVGLLSSARRGVSADEVDHGHAVNIERIREHVQGHGEGL